jgi:S1-C subfamily serine protease
MTDQEPSKQDNNPASPPRDGSNSDPISSTSPGSQQPNAAPWSYYTEQYNNPYYSQTPYGSYGSQYDPNYGYFYPGWANYGSFPVNPRPPTTIELTPTKAHLWFFVGILAAIIGALLGTFLTAVYVNPDTQQTLVKVETGPPAPLGQPVNIAAVLAKVMPATVSIDAEVANGTQAGSGMIISKNGEILTNNHVIAGAISISVTLYGQSKTIPAHLLGANPGQDIALLKINNVTNLPTVKFASPSEIQQGNAVIAIGNALALQGGPSVTTGIISGLNRSETIQNDSGGTETLSNLIQTDAPINPGNSGGPLALANGDVIGMNTAAVLASLSFGSSTAQNIGFAIPVTTIEQVLPGLRANNNSVSPSTRPVLGVDVTNLTPALIAAHNLSQSTGAYVVNVFPDSPAALAGIKPGDVIVEIAGQPVVDTNSLSNDLASLHPGQTVSVSLYRNNVFIKLKVTLGSQAP